MQECVRYVRAEFPLGASASVKAGSLMGSEPHAKTANRRDIIRELSNMDEVCIKCGRGGECIVKDCITGKTTACNNRKKMASRKLMLLYRRAVVARQTKKGNK
jgi:hypothetical protein